MGNFCDNKQCSRHTLIDLGDGHAEELVSSPRVGFSGDIRENFTERKIISSQEFKSELGSFKLCETCAGVLNFITTGGETDLNWTMFMMRVRDTAQSHNLTIREANELWNAVLMAKTLGD